MNDIFLAIKKQIENLGFKIIGHDFNRPWGGFLVIDEDQSQKFANQLWPYGVNDASRFGPNGFDSNGAPDVAALIRANNVGFQQLTGQLDDLAEEVEQFEQDIANAEARYSGLFGKMRFKRDIKKGKHP